MKPSLLLLFVAIVACQQPTSSVSDASGDRYRIQASIDGSDDAASGLTGIVTWTNKPGHAGKITTADGSVFVYNVNAGHTVDGFRPSVGDLVTFSADNGASARFVRLADTNDDDDDGDGDGDGGGDNPPPPPPPPPLW
jgi:hypothetical protein